MTLPLDRTTLRQAQAVLPAGPRIEGGTEAPDKSVRNATRATGGLRLSDASVEAAVSAVGNGAGGGWSGGGLSPEAAQRAWLADMIWLAWPADSKTACSEIAAADLCAMGMDVTARHVRRLLNCDHSASFVIVNAVLGKVGPEQIFTVVRRRP